MLVYLGGAIDYATGAERVAWREEAGRELVDVGISTYNPSTAFAYDNVEGNISTAKALKTINDVAMVECDALIFYLPKKVNTVGSIVELTFLAHNYKDKPVFIVIPDITQVAHISAYLVALAGIAGENDSPEQEQNSSWKFYLGSGSLDRAIEGIVKIDDDFMVEVDGLPPIHPNIKKQNIDCWSSGIITMPSSPPPPPPLPAEDELDL